MFPALRETPRRTSCPWPSICWSAWRPCTAAPGAAFSPAAQSALEGYDWPGNVRELKNAIERALVFAKAPILAPEDFPENVRNTAAGAGSGLLSLEQIERTAIAATLDATRYKITRAAEILGISRKTLLDKRKKYGLQ